MNREEGFPIADFDIGLMHDPKVVALAKRLRDPQQTLAYVGMYVALVLESWSRGDRATLEEAAPAWWLDPVDDIAAELKAVGLLGEGGRVVEHAFDGWFRPAWERREKRRASGAEGGRRSWDKRRSSGASAALSPSVSRAVRPASTQAGPAVAHARETIEPLELDTSGAAQCTLCKRPTSVHTRECPNALTPKADHLREQLDRIFEKGDAA